MSDDYDYVPNYYCMVYDHDETYANDGPFESAEDARKELLTWLRSFQEENWDNFNEYEAKSVSQALGDLLSGIQNEEYHLEDSQVFVTQAFGMKLEVYHD